MAFAFTILLVTVLRVFELHPDPKSVNRGTIQKYGGDDGTRTRGLCRDRVAGQRNLLELNGTDSPLLIL